MSPLLIAAQAVATVAHHGQLRRYTERPYVTHPAAVAERMRLHDAVVELQAAAWLHDVVEDTAVTLDQLAAHFPPETVAAVDYMTERFTSSSYPGMNRAARKAAELERLAGGTPAQQSLKLADLIDNTGSIVERDPKFAAVYLPEKRALLDALDRAWSSMRNDAYDVLTSAERMLAAA